MRFTLPRPFKKNGVVTNDQAPWPRREWAVSENRIVAWTKPGSAVLTQSSDERNRIARAEAMLQRQRFSTAVAPRGRGADQAWATSRGRRIAGPSRRHPDKLAGLDHELARTYGLRRVMLYPRVPRVVAALQD